MAYLILEFDSRRVLAKTESQIVAPFVSSAFPSSHVVRMDKQHLEFLEKTLKVKLNQHHLKMERWSQFKRLTKKELSHDFLRNKELAQWRCRYLLKLEKLFLNTLLDKIRFIHPNYSQFIIYELSKCEAKKDQFSVGIRDYAQILGISEIAAYRELAMQMDSDSSLALRNLAFFQRYALKINALFDFDEMDEVYRSARKSVFVNARI